jgi:molybdopterin-guanine dinucleotide biosynthesis protein A
MRETLPLPLTALILCGGKSVRMGRPKAFLPYQGTTMIAHILKTVQDLFNEVFLVANEPGLFEDFNCDVVKDILPYRGPLGGILSGLLVASNHYSFVLACDMPFVDRRLLREMTMRRHGSDVLVLMHANGIEPLIGIYSKSCIKPLEESLFAGEPNLYDFVSGLNAEAFFYEAKQELSAQDAMPPYFNIDTPQDYSKAITRSPSSIHQFPGRR